MESNVTGKAKFYHREYHCPAGSEAVIQVQTLPEIDIYLQGI